MNLFVKYAVGRLKAQQVPVGPRLTPGGQILIRSFPQAQGDGQGGFGFDPLDESGDALQGQRRVFARLKDDGSVAELDGVGRAS